MFIVTTAMFALGIIALALDTSLTYQQFTFDLSPTSGALWSPRRTNVVAATGATIICTIVSGALSLSFITPTEQIGLTFICVSPPSVCRQVYYQRRRLRVESGCTVGL